MTIYPGDIYKPNLGDPYWDSAVVKVMSVDNEHVYHIHQWTGTTNDGFYEHRTKTTVFIADINSGNLIKKES